MKKIKSNFTFIVMAIVMLFVCMMPFSAISQKKAFALSADYSGEENTIYYFSDSMPIMDDTILTNVYGEAYNIVYDLQFNLTSQDLDSMYTAGYFDGFGENCVVIMELKTIFANSTTLSDIFTSLRGQGCKIVFVSGTPQEAYNINFENYVDAFVKCKSGLYYFVINALKDIAARNEGNWNGACILIDGRFVDVPEYYTPDNIGDLYNSYLYLHTLFDELKEYLNLADDLTPAELAAELSEAGLTLLVHTSDNRYIDILTGEDYYLYEGNIYSDEILNYNADFEAYYAMGRSALENAVYADWLGLQVRFGFGNMPVYLWEVEPIQYGEGGLEIISDGALAEAYGLESQDDMEALMSALNNIGV